MNFAVLMATYNGESCENLHAAFSAISRQSLLPDQIVLVVDGEIRRELSEILDYWVVRLPIDVLHQQKSGLGQALNLGLKNCRFDLVIRCDSDDISNEDRFKEQLDCLLSYDVDVVSHAILETVGNNSTGKVRSVSSGMITAKNLICIFRNPLNHNCCAFKRASVLAVGGYPLSRMEDYRLWLKMLNNGSTFFNSQSILLRADASNLTNRRIGIDYLSAEWKLAIDKLTLYPFYYIPIIFIVTVFRIASRLPVLNSLLPLLYSSVLRRTI